MWDFERWKQSVRTKQSSLGDTVYGEPWIHTDHQALLCYRCCYRCATNCLSVAPATVLLNPSESLEYVPWSLSHIFISSVFQTAECKFKCLNSCLGDTVVSGVRRSALDFLTLELRASYLNSLRWCLKNQHHLIMPLWMLNNICQVHRRYPIPALSLMRWQWNGRAEVQPHNRSQGSGSSFLGQFKFWPSHLNN